MNKILFPADPNTNLDFAPSDGSVGWVKTNTSLADMAKAIVNGNIAVADHAIPSPLAHVRHFWKRLTDEINNKEIKTPANNEWRGMLAAIALRKAMGINITTKTIPLVDANLNPVSKFSGVVFSELVDYDRISKINKGFANDGKLLVNYTALTIYCKDDEPFAMKLPGMIICPFKEYPANLFSDLDWYNSDTNTWGEVRDAITPTAPSADLSETAVKLYKWLDSVAQDYGNIQPLSTFMDYILGDQRAPSDGGTDGNGLDKTAPRADTAVTDGNADGIFSRYCPAPEGAPEKVFTDKILVIIPPADHFTGERNGMSYLIDRSTFTEAKFTPKKLIHNDKEYYILPPIHTDVVKSMRANTAKLLSWNVTAAFDGADGKDITYTMEIKLQFPGGATLPYVRKYRTRDIVWTMSMPYISTWPYVNLVGKDNTWKEYLVSVLADQSVGGENTRQASFFSAFKDNERCTGVKTRVENGRSYTDFKISMVAADDFDPEVFDCMSYFKAKDFRMIRSKSRPYALTFQYGDDFLGSWILDYSKAPMVQKQDGTFRVGIDFGTTSTNVYLSCKDPSEHITESSISCAGKYTCDIFNPYVTSQNFKGQVDSDFLQDYFLFSSKKGEMGKIFTYGQTFEAEKDDSPIKGKTQSNITGRSVVVNERFITETGKGSTGIFNGLKMNGTLTGAKLDAAKNFIDNILTYAILEAKMYGVIELTIWASFPAAHFGNVVMELLKPIISSLSTKSGIKINIEGATEAQAAGVYFSTLPNNAAVAKDGYAIVDIGGGTTDISYWKGDSLGQNVLQYDEYSYGYAGNFLVVRSILQAIRDKQSFADMWDSSGSAGNSLRQELVSTFNNIDTTYPIPDATRLMIANEDWEKKFRTLDFLLEMIPINKGVLSDESYNNFLSLIRMKYYSLFYLIAYHISANRKENGGRIELGNQGFKICLAGCGSKGIDICCSGNEVFMAQLDRLVRSILKLSATFNFEIARPDNPNKKEVVLGLTRFDRDVFKKSIEAAVAAGTLDLGDDDDLLKMAGYTSANDLDTESKDKREEIVPELSLEHKKLAFRRLVGVLAQLENIQAHPNHILHQLIFKDGERTPAEEYFDRVQSSVEVELRRANPNPKTYDKQFALLMFENIANNFLQY